MSFDNGLAPSVQSANIQEASVPRSSFNMSRVINTNGIIGAIIPFDILETLPNEDYEISYDILALTRNPLVRRLQNGFTMYVHTYYSKKKDLWKGFKNYYDKGRSGTHIASVPKYYPSMSSTGNTSSGGTPLGHNSGDYSFLTTFSPLCYMGVPATAIDTSRENVNSWYVCSQGGDPVKSTKKYINNGYNNPENETKFGISALPLVMYNKIYRDYYANENILGKNNKWYHENDDEDLILPYDSEEWVNCCDGTLKDYGIPTGAGAVEAQYNVTNENSDFYIPRGDCGQTEHTSDYPMLNMLHFRQFKGDYFTTANIFKDLIRGSTPTISLGNIESMATDSDWESLIVNSGATSTVGLKADGELNGNLVLSNSLPSAQWGDVINSTIKKMKLSLGNGTSLLNGLRKAIVMEKLLQRNATTNGNYRELVGASFGYYPDDENRKPIYIGGSYQPIVFNEVVQTSASESGSPLGTTGSRGMSAETGYIGKFHSDDFGYIMSVLSIVPDTYYNTQAIDPLFTRTEQDLEYIPILNNLEPEPVKNKELYISGDAEYDEDVFGYVNRYENMKSRRNIISGLGALGEYAIYDSSTFMKRTFTNENKPQLNQQFLAMSLQNIDMTPFTSKNEPPFDLMIGCNIDKVSPMPYKAEPCDLGIRY